MRAVISISRAARGLLAGLALTALAACGGVFSVDYPPMSADVSKGLRVSAVNVSVPESLTVSEANVLVPSADIVWHGEPDGDRRAQVKAIMTTAARAAVAPMRGTRRVNLNIIVSQFHGETEAAILRSPSAVHSIRFTAQLVDASTGAAVTPPVPISADLAAYVGDAALEAQRRHGGPFMSWQKPRVTAHVTEVLKGWLGLGPDIRGSFNSLGR